MSSQDPSNWAEATRRLINDVRQAQRNIREQDLRCPHCTAANRPNATVIERQAPDRAFCIVCSKTFNPQQQEQ